jgi:hypothetical protein
MEPRAEPDAESQLAPDEPVEHEDFLSQLSDKVIQRCFAASLHLASLDGLIASPVGRERLAAVITELDGMIGEVRRAAFARARRTPNDLRAAVLDASEVHRSGATSVSALGWLLSMGGDAPSCLSSLPGVELAAYGVSARRRLFGTGGWWDLVALDDEHLLFTLGTVAGDGDGTRETAAALFNLVRIVASDARSPATILACCSNWLRVEGDGRVASALVAVIDVHRHQVTLANAGYPRPLLVGSGGADFLDMPVGSPIGGALDGPYVSEDVALEAGTTLLAFTEAAVERACGSLHGRLAQLSRLRDLALVEGGSSPADLVRVVATQLPADASDGSAFIALRLSE